jgi:hypothetical protein
VGAFVGSVVGFSVIVGARVGITVGITVGILAVTVGVLMIVEGASEGEKGVNIVESNVGKLDGGEIGPRLFDGCEVGSGTNNVYCAVGKEVGCKVGGDVAVGKKDADGVGAVMHVAHVQLQVHIN